MFWWGTILHETSKDIVEAKAYASSALLWKKKAKSSASAAINQTSKQKKKEKKSPHFSLYLQNCPFFENKAKKKKGVSEFVRFDWQSNYEH